MNAVADIAMPPKLIDVFSGEADVRGAYGGRGSGKTQNFAKMTAVRAYMWDQAGREGVIVCGREHLNSLDDSSMAEVKSAILSEPWLAEHFEIGEKYIRTKSRRISYKFSGLESKTVQSLKSTTKILLLWADEAEPITDATWDVVLPTLRQEDSELWVTWNPARKSSATDRRFRQATDPRFRVVELNWRDNPRFPAILERQRARWMTSDPDSYDHVWEGAYATATKGAYFTRQLSEMRREGRIGRVAHDPLMTRRLFADIGGTGRNSDAFALWGAQFVGREVRVLDYYEQVGQEVGHHLQWMRDHNYLPSNTSIWLPHDGATNDRIFAVSYESAFTDASYTVEVVPNQGRGAVVARINAARRVFPSVWVNEETTEPGIEALGWYHEKWDDERDVGLGPEHDWCFSAGTEVMTPSGWIPIRDLSVHNKVVTPCGNRRIIRSGIVRTTDKWITTRGIRSTPEHRFFTKRGLVTAGNLQSTDEFWTREDWGLRILGSLCAMLYSGFMDAITSATQEATDVERQSSYTAWCTRLFMARFLSAMKSITSTITHSIITLTTLKRCLSSSIAVITSQSPAISACAEYAEQYLGAIKCLDVDAAQRVSEPIMHESSASAEPAYSLTVDRDECYFVRGNDGIAYLVANSSHGADAWGLMAVVAEEHMRNGGGIVRGKQLVRRGSAMAV
jgi:phage terminase large subunit